MRRRNFNALVAASVAAGAAAMAVPAFSRAKPKRMILYTGAGSALTHYDLDVEAAALVKRDTITLPSPLQYAWPHPSNRWLYAATSDQPSGSRAIAGTTHRLCALRIGADGALSMHGEPAKLRQRPIHNTVDHSGHFAFCAYNTESDVTVHRINTDGTLGLAVEHGALDTGIFPHQVRVTPDNKSVILVARGNNANAQKPEDPGSLNLFRLSGGKLTPQQKVVPGGNGGLGFGARHLDFHPTKPWVYVALERQNRLQMYHMAPGGFSPEPMFDQPTTDPVPKGQHQVLGTVHVHPRGHVVYTANRASGSANVNGVPTFQGGDNSIAVFAIDQTTGEPTLIQKIDTRGLHPRAFTVDPTGRLLIAANMVGMAVRDGDGLRQVPASLAVFRIAEDGTLSFVRKYDIDLVGGNQLVWVKALTI